MSTKPLPVGVDDFEKLITNGYYFVDKTMMIKELLDKKGDVNLFIRPRRFGKSLNMIMIRYFFEDGRDALGNKADNVRLFENFAIMQCGDEYIRKMGIYPVITLSLKSAKQENFVQSLESLKDDIAEEFERHAYILQSEHLTDYMKQKYTAIMENRASRSDYNKSLKFLSKCLKAYSGRKVIILIDEYDVPLKSAHLYGYYPEMSAFIRSLFESVLKTNPHMEFAVLTGCMRISREPIFTGMNNLKINSILDKNYDEYFGFTTDEVKKLCRDYGMPERFETIKDWYNGYLFGDENVYNPWSLIQYVDDLSVDIHELPKPYWANTSSNSIVRGLIEQADQDARNEIEKLIEGAFIEKPVHEDITYDEVDENTDNLWNLMFFTGYFRKVKERMEAGEKYITLAIPNEEVRYIFKNKVRVWFQEQVKKRNQSKLFHALVSLDAVSLQEEIVEILKSTISFNDYYENFYHGFLAGILYGMDGYVVKSNREGGTGRTDLFVKPVSRKETAYVFEFKVADRYENLGRMADEALAQIEKKEYGRELKNEGYYKIVNCGISFFGKDCEVKLMLQC